MRQVQLYTLLLVNIELSQYRLKRLSFPPRNVTFSKLSWPKIFGFISRMSILLHTSMPILMPSSIRFDYCIFVVSFEVRKYKSSNFVLHFRYHLALWGSLHIHMNLRICFSILFL